MQSHDPSKTSPAVVPAALLFLALAGPAPGQSVDLSPILTIEGQTDETHLELTRSDLLSMPQQVVRTSTPWQDGVHEFSGPTLYDVLRRAGSKGDRVLLEALNDYTVEFPVSEISEEAPIVAVKLDGKEMDIREKGPFWVIYPYDSDPKYSSEVIYARSIWQLARIIVKD